MLFSKNRIRIKGGDSQIEHYIFHHQLSGVKDCSRERLKISHTVYYKETSYGCSVKERLYEMIKVH